MRYPHSHKQTIRRRILGAAGRVFRERGVAETGVDDVMRAAGLTHGGFYAYFDGKAQLVAEASAEAFAAAIPNLDRIARAPTAAARTRLMIDSYLAARHRDNRGAGCFVVAVGADMARLKGELRTEYAREFSAHLDRLAAALRLSPDPGESREKSTQLLSALVGGLLLARAIEDPVRSDALLQAMRRRLRREFAGENERAPQPSATHDFMRAF